MNRLVQYNFNAAAQQYLDHAQIQRIPAIWLIENLVKLYQTGLILDLGSGPSSFNHHAQNICYPIINYDLSHKMLVAARALGNNNLVCGDAQLLPFAPESFALIISNLMLQWPENKTQVFNQLSQALQPDGYLMFSTLIKPSLWQLTNAWAKIDDYQHTLNFLFTQDYQQLCRDNGFKIIELYVHEQQYFFPDFKTLLHNFKLTGTSLPKSIANKGLGGRKLLNDLEENYNLYRTNQGLVLSYYYLMVIAQKERL